MLIFKKANFVALITALSLAGANCKKKPSPPLVKVPPKGSAYKIGDQQGIVVGSGAATYFYTATGESLVVLDLARPGMMLALVPAKGAKVVVDPAKPSLTVDGEEKLDSNWKSGKTLILVQYNREKR